MKVRFPGSRRTTKRPNCDLIASFTGDCWKIQLPALIPAHSASTAAWRPSRPLQLRADRGQSPHQSTWIRRATAPRLPRSARSPALRSIRKRLAVPVSDESGSRADRDSAPEFPDYRTGQMPESRVGNSWILRCQHMAVGGFVMRIEN